MAYGQTDHWGIFLDLLGLEGKKHPARLGGMLGVQGAEARLTQLDFVELTCLAKLFIKAISDDFGTGVLMQIDCSPSISAVRCGIAQRRPSLGVEGRAA